MKQKEYPSQKRYRTNNPSVSFRLKKEDKETLDAILKATGKPISKWVSDFLHDEMDLNGEISELVKRIHELEVKNKELAIERRFNVPCPDCGKPMYFSSKYSNWPTEIYPKLKEVFGKLHHKMCKSR
ncbi:hypothetical protein [uncultured Methanoregula sp.]|uniref:hypothetical protein n=1 Tax=uncultured Methanoregula sp. TaxID=1005933 RepID=UPI002AAB4808|nr:hypothetical protein [uncultured Methanoregula sp.]